MTYRALLASSAVIVVAATLTAASAFAGTVNNDPAFQANVFAPNDDGFTGPVALGFSANFFGTTFTDTFVNNNGNITFGAGLHTFTPFGLTGPLGEPIIAPFFADVDTRSAGSPVTYGTGTVNGHNAFGVDYVNVDYFGSSPSHTNRNSFQVLLIDRSDIGAGDFDIEFNYDQIQWETGNASGGDSAGLGGSCAVAGYSNGTGDPGTNFQLPGSGVCGSFLDGTGLTAASTTEAVGADDLVTATNDRVPGQFLFEVINGQVVPPPPPPSSPEPASLALIGTGLAALGALRRRKGK